MCLDKITKVYKPSLFNLFIPKFAYKSGVGWKEFRKNRDGSLISRFADWGRGVLDVNKFLDEWNYRADFIKNQSKIDGFHKNYDFGWHICLELPTGYDAFDDVIRRVEYKYGHTEGIDATYKAPTIVAKYIKILEE